MSKIIKIRIILWSLLAAITLWLVWQAIVPFGNITYTGDGGEGSYFIQKLTPAERVGLGEDGTVRITGDPVYFNLRAPRRFDKAELTLVYKRGKGAKLLIGSLAPDHEPTAPIIEAGVQADGAVRNYALKPIENRTIDQLSLVWDTMREGQVVLLQKDKKFDSVAAFLENLLPREEIAIYNYDLRSATVIPDYATSSKLLTLTQNLRGAYQFYTYLGEGEELDFSFSFVDVNQNSDGDPVDIDLYFQGALIESRHLDDDGITADSGKLSDRRELELKLAGLPVGAYKIEVRAKDDIITRQIAAKQQKMSFINKLRLAGADEENIELYTDSNRIFVVTEDPAKLQTIRAGDAKLKLEETYKQYDLLLRGTTTKIILEKDGLTLAGDGVFSFSPEELLNPDYKKVNASLDIVGAGIKYVIAEYVTPQKDGDWFTATTEFDLPDAYRENDAYGFIISVPGLKAEEGVDDYVEVKEIKVELDGKSLYAKLREILKL